MYVYVTSFITREELLLLTELGAQYEQMYRIPTHRIAVRKALELYVLVTLLKRKGWCFSYTSRKHVCDAFML